MTRWWFLPLSGLGAVVAIECATPTVLTVTIYSELACTKGSAVALVGAASLGELIGKAPSSVSATCDADGRMGSVAILPSGSKDESVAFAVMQRADGQPADGCLDPLQSKGCIVAKRQLRFGRHVRSDMRVDMRLSCLGVLCATDETCVKGTCVAAELACGRSCDDGTFDVKADAGASAQDPRIADADVADGGPRLPGLPDASQPPTAYQDITNPAYWERFDLAPLGGGSEFTGGVYDGRYVYFSPAFRGQERIVRYDTHAPFAVASSWSTHRTGSLGWGGAVSDGRFVYFLPFTAEGFLRHDPLMPFDAASAWNLVPDSLTHFVSTAGGVFDGRYIYASPNASANFPPAVVNRFDTRGAPESHASWTQFDVTTDLPAPGLSSMLLGGYDGRHIYFTPDDFSSIAVRYDTRQSFAAKASWDSVDLLPFDARFVGGFRGSVSDGRYVYMPSDSSNLILRYDSALPFVKRQSWVEYVLPESVRSTAFDGRYLYFGAGGGQTTYRYDSKSPFTQATSWQSFDAKVGRIDGIVFDGHFMYFVPESNSNVVARFEAVVAGTASPVLPGRAGSF